MIKYEILLKLRQHLNKQKLDEVMDYPLEALVILLAEYEQQEARRKNAKV